MIVKSAESTLNSKMILEESLYSSEISLDNPDSDKIKRDQMTYRYTVPAFEFAPDFCHD